MKCLKTDRHAPKFKLEFQFELKTEPHIEDRVAERRRPEGTPKMHQSSGKLLFMHWQVPVESLRPLVPLPLTFIDD